MAYTNIDDPSAFFQIALWTGTGTVGNAVTFDGNSDMQPDMVWSKRRDSATSHVLKDTSRGGTSNNDLHLVPDLTNAENTYANYRMDFNSDGFTLDGAGDTGFQGSGTSMVSWAWKANGGTTASNTDGNITSTVQSDTIAGFSLVTYTGNGTDNQTIGHGLGVQPSWWIVKRRDTTGDWWFGASSILGGTSNYLKLNSLAANAEISNIWGDSPTSSTLFRVSNNAGLNASSGTYVAYLFANKQGYSKFGKYTGAGSGSPFVYTGFKPALVICKRTDSTNDWGIVDSKRETYNGATKTLFADLTNAESSTYTVDLLSNGFRPSSNHGIFNQSGGSYIYMAFAEAPFTTSSGIPTTAR